MGASALTVRDDTPLLSDDFADAALMGTPDQGFEEVELPSRVSAPLPRKRAAAAGGSAGTSIEPDPGVATKAIFEDFVRLVAGKPKVWAIYVRADDAVVHVWTFVDSTDWRDRSPVYEAEWEMLVRYPKTPFDFNVELARAGTEHFEGETAAFVFTR